MSMDYEELESRYQWLQAENEALRKLRQDDQDAYRDSIERLETELAELKGRNCEGCNSCFRCVQRVTISNRIGSPWYLEKINCCSLWEAKE